MPVPTQPPIKAGEFRSTGNVQYPTVNIFAMGKGKCLRIMQFPKTRSLWRIEHCGVSNMSQIERSQNERWGKIIACILLDR